MPTLHWTESDTPHDALWRSEAGVPPPAHVLVADDRLTADAAIRLADAGTAILWRGDFQNARHLLVAMARRVDRRARRPGKPPALPREAFERERAIQGQRARTLGMLLIPIEANGAIALRRAPDLRQACAEAWGPATAPCVASLRELLGIVGAHEWRRKGVEVAALGARLHPHYGVFAPIRQEYVELVASAPLPSREIAFDIGTGTGVLAALLAKRGVARVIATDHDPRALACARDNVARLRLGDRVEVVEADLFPDDRAGLVVCNPPWLPVTPSSRLDAAVYDPDSRMLNGFLAGLAAHLAPGGEGWLVLSDLAEHLGMRSRDELLAQFARSGLRVIGRIEAKPSHRRVADRDDPLHAARAAEVTSLWRLAAAV